MSSTEPLFDPSLSPQEKGRLLLKHASVGTTEQALALIEAGATLDEKTNRGGTPLIIAAFNNNEPLIRALVAKGADLEEKSYIGHTALVSAVCWGRTVGVRVLLELGPGSMYAMRMG